MNTIKKTIFLNRAHLVTLWIRFFCDKTLLSPTMHLQALLQRSHPILFLLWAPRNNSGTVTSVLHTRQQQPPPSESTKWTLLEPVDMLPGCSLLWVQGFHWLERCHDIALLDFGHSIARKALSRCGMKE